MAHPCPEIETLQPLAIADLFILFRITEKD